MKKKLLLLLLTLSSFTLLSGCSTINTVSTDTISTQDFSELHDQMNFLKTYLDQYMASPQSPSDYKLLTDKDITTTYTEADSFLFTQIDNISSTSYKDASLLLTFYDADNNLISSATSYLDTLLTGKTYYTSFYYPSDKDNVRVPFDHYELQMKAYPYTTEVTDYTDKINVASNETPDGYILSKVTNQSDIVVNSINMYICYYDEKGAIIGVETNSVYDLIPGAYDVISFSLPYDADYNDIPFADYKIGISSAINSEVPYPTAPPAMDAK